MLYSEDVIRLIMGLKVRHLREERGVTLQELSRRTDISVSYLNEIEKGKKHPKPSKAAAIAEALGTSYDKLVSLQLDKKLEPIARLLSSNLLYDLQLDHFGLDPAMMVENFSGAPDKLTAILSTIGEIGRQYDVSLESFYLATLRTYQEMHFNYYPEIEAAAEQLMELLGKRGPELRATDLLGHLTSTFQVEVKADLDVEPGLESLRSLMVPQRNLLRINSGLSEAQKRFVAARELGFRLLKLQQRPLTSAWVKIGKFDEVLNNFKASYFAGALLLPQDDMVESLQKVFRNRQWQPQLLEAEVAAAGVSPEMYLHRATSILPRFFGVKQLFFLKFEHDTASNEIELIKELHLGGLHSPHAKSKREHYCNRWVSVTVLRDLARRQQTGDQAVWLSGIQRSHYPGKGEEYLVLSMARSFHPAPAKNSSITIGMLLNDSLRQAIHFTQDSSVPDRQVGNTCERCPVQDCAERRAPATVLEKLQQQAALEAAVAAALH